MIFTPVPEVRQCDPNSVRAELVEALPLLLVGGKRKTTLRQAQGERWRGYPSTQFLPAIVREGAVRFGHAVRVLTLLDGVAAVLRGVHQLARQAARHGLLRPRAGGRDQPA